MLVVKKTQSFKRETKINLLTRELISAVDSVEKRSLKIQSLIKAHICEKKMIKYTKEFFKYLGEIMFEYNGNLLSFLSNFNYSSDEILRG